jgi:hypothetical protein
VKAFSAITSSFHDGSIAKASCPPDSGSSSITCRGGMVKSPAKPSCKASMNSG